VFTQGVPAPVQATTFPVPEHVDVAALAQATPALQHALPQGVVPAGHPQVLAAALTQATPALQQHWLQGVVPGAHGTWLAVVAPVQATRSLASPRNGLSTVATAAVPTAAPIILRALRRVVAPAIIRLSSSKRKAINSSRR
jgi:hypothetical protein